MPTANLLYLRKRACNAYTTTKGYAQQMLKVKMDSKLAHKNHQLEGQTGLHTHQS
jgi:hypothetical protein